MAEDEDMEEALVVAAATKAKTKKGSKTAVAGMAFVRREFLEGGRLLSEEIEDYDEKDLPQIAVRLFESPPAHVLRVQSATVNMGNFESLRTVVGVVMPCYPAEIDDCYTFVDEWVSSKVLMEISEAKGKGEKEAATAKKPATFFKKGRR